MSSDAHYKPCWIGLHVCGQSPDGDEPVTVLNLPTRTGAQARWLFARAKAECELRDDEPRALVVDLNLGFEGHGIEDFSMSRQMLERLAAIAREDGP